MRIAASWLDNIDRKTNQLLPPGVEGLMFWKNIAALLFLSTGFA